MRNDSFIINPPLAFIYHYEGNRPQNKHLRCHMIGWSHRTPAKRFRLLLAGAILSFSLVMSIILYFSLDRYVIEDTAKNTESAVQYHFAYLFGNLFANREATVSQQWYKVVRMHFDIYQIVTADFYEPQGTVVFSYDNQKVGKPADQPAMQMIRSVLQSKRPIPLLHGDKLSLWMVVNDEHSNDVQGIVHVVRDISYKKEAFRRVLATCLFALYLCGVVLYYSLKRVYDRSTEQLAEKAEEIRQMLGEIEATYDASLQALSSALDSRDNETNGHSYRVTAYTIRLAQEMGVNREQLTTIMRGALLHDVGKIGVPDSILLKQGPLTTEEWVRMRSHVEIGYHMLKHIPFLESALEIVRFHHERWDGTGYPYGLKGEEIPLSARIFAVCDAYDAITSDRPYRKGRSYEEALREIAAQSGRQFDPSVVEALQRISPEEWIGIGQRATLFHEQNRQFDQLNQFSRADASKVG
jgi:putative nucleotidyltransferase with HDIG domain